MAHVGEDRTMKLDDRENVYWDNLFSVIKQTEYLERAFLSDKISASDYETQVLKLLNLYNSLKDTLKLRDDEEGSGVRLFMRDYNLDNCRAAVKRLLEDKMPATQIHVRAGPGPKNTRKLIADTTQIFIATMDFVNPDFRSELLFSDETVRLLRPLVDNLNLFTDVRLDWPARVKLHNWLRTFMNRQATVVVSTDERRQLLADLETAHHDFTVGDFER
jgi:hypothetical protein